MSDEEVKFIDRLYKDLYLSDSVQHHTNSKDKYKNIKDYINKLEDLHSRIVNHNHVDTLKRMYHDKYVISEENIPESYYKHQQQMALDRGYGYVELDNGDIRELNEIVINDQKKSLDTWLDYLLSEDSNYIPFWAKYWAFQGMLKLGSFNKETGKYSKRTKSTTAKFADLNREALALSIDALLKYLNRKTISDKELEIIVKTGSFQSIYTYITNRLLSNNHNIVKRNEGIWIKYDQGSDHMPLVNSLQGYNTGWCTAGEETAEAQLQGGDFYVYYSLDENDDYKVPRIAIRMEGNTIGEIRGVADEQNLEPEMEEVVAEKIKDFPDKDKYYKKVSDMEKLTKIYKKYLDEDLSKEDLRFLYEVDSKIEGFGYEEDPRIEQIIWNRDEREDLAYILDLKKEQVALGESQLTDETVYYRGLLRIFCCENSELIKLHTIKDELNRTAYYRGSVRAFRCENSKPVKFPTIIDGSLSIIAEGNIDVKNIILPKVVKKNLTLTNFANAEDLNLPENIGGNLSLIGLLYGKGLKINKLGGHLYLNDLKSAVGLELPKEINGSLSLYRLQNPEGLILPKKINGDLDLVFIESIKGLVFPKGIKSLNLTYLKQEEDIKILEDIKGNICLNSLETCNDLILPNYVGNMVILANLISAKNIVLPQHAKMVSLDTLKDFENIVIPNPLTYKVVLDGHRFINYEDLKEYADEHKRNRKEK